MKFTVPLVFILSLITCGTIVSIVCDTKPCASKNIIPANTGTTAVVAKVLLTKENPKRILTKENPKRILTKAAVQPKKHPGAIVNRRGDRDRSKPALASRGYLVRVVATAYSGSCPVQHTGARTATGRNANRPDGCAVDPRVIPLGSIVEINGIRKKADDTGGAIKGHRIDWRVENLHTARKFGRQRVTVRVYPPGKRL